MNQKIRQIKLLYPIGIAVLFMSLFSLALPWSVAASVEQQISAEVRIQVLIERVEALDCFDSNIGGQGCEGPPDFYAHVAIENSYFDTATLWNQDDITPTKWVFSKIVPLNTPTVSTQIDIWDNDSDLLFNGDEHADLTLDSLDAISLSVNINECLLGRIGGVSGNFGSAQKCGDSIISEGNSGNPARIRFRVLAEVANESIVIVRNEAGQPVTGAEVRHFRLDSHQHTYSTDETGKVAILDLRPQDELVAMQLVHQQPVKDTSHTGWLYRTYLTSFDYAEDTGDALSCIVGTHCGTTVLELIVKKRSPLVLFNLIVSVGWGADTTDVSDNNFLGHLRRALISANEVIFDVTDGQFAFGNVEIHNGREAWEEADIQITPSNYRRPYAIAGGINRHEPYTYTSSVLSTTVFYPGYIRIGRAWDQRGSPDTQLSNPDGFRMLAHEFAHYAFMILDEYFYFDRENVLQPATCPGSLMFNSYTANLELDLQGNPLWSTSCRLTEQFLTHGESAWETLARAYADQSSPPRWEFRLPYNSSKPGPVELPFHLTSISTPVPGGQPDLANGDGLVQLTVRTNEGKRFYAGQIQVFTLRKNERNVLRVFEQGTVNQDGVIELVSMKVNDVIVARSWDGLSFGTKPYVAGRDMIMEMGSATWRPIITANPIQNTNRQVTGLAIEVTLADPPEGELMAAAIPLFGVVTITNAITLTPTAQNTYVGTWHFLPDQTLDEAFLWVGDVKGGKDHIYENLSSQVVLPITLGGSPDSHKRSNPPRHPSSSDGYCQLHVPNAEWSADLPVIVLSPHNLPLLDSAMRLVSAPCYIGVPTSTTTFGQPVALTIYYNREAAQGIQYDQLQIYHWDASANQWKLVNGRTIDSINYFVSAVIHKPGLYVAMETAPLYQSLLPFVSR